MRTKITILALALTTILNAQFWQKVNSTSYTIHNFCVINENLVWGWQGKSYTPAFFKFEKNGNSWTDIASNYYTSNFPSSFLMSDFSAISANTAFVVGVDGDVNRKMYKTNNGGTSWSLDTNDWQNQILGFSHIKFFDNNNGVIVGRTNDFFKIYTTSNSGESWYNTTNIATIPLYNETPLSGNGGINRFSSKKGNSMVFVTTKRASSTGDLGKVCRIFKSDDKGQNWYVLFDFSQNNNLDLRQFGSIDIKDNNTIYFTAYSKTLKKDLVLYTTDNGTTLNYFAVSEVIGIIPFDNYYYSGGNPNEPGYPNDNDSDSYYSRISTVPGNDMLVYTAVGGINGVNSVVTKYSQNNHTDSSSWKTVEEKFYNNIYFENANIGFAGKDGLSRFNPQFLKIQENKLNELKFYPNPVKDLLNFSEQVSNVKIADISGKIVKQITTQEKIVDVSGLAKGMYIITATTKDGKSISHKVIKE